MPSRSVSAILASTSVIPVLTVPSVAVAVPLARALVAGGLHVLEITLRNAVALDAIDAIMREVPDAVVGAGTVVTRAQLKAVKEQGCRFAVSPGFTPALLDAAESQGVPFLPGVATAGEAMALIERGYSRAKLFPAEAVGGIKLLKGLGEPLPQLKFCPTGGINADNVADYLALPNVVCVGGSWVAPKEALEAGDWRRIEELARSAAALRSATS
jgi:2-dehydro-3-deoxyphosphogluconate aldolase/(4S)-4-hydroxy-2-oxoglutarate aldolase